MDWSGATQARAGRGAHRDLRGWLVERRGAVLVSSALARVEVLRTCRRIDERLPDTGRAVVNALHLVPLDDEVLGAAAQLPDSHLGSLDALHLASALEIGLDLETFVAYDTRLVTAGHG